MKKTKAKKILSIFIVLILLINTSAFLYATSVIEDPVDISFEDKNLYDAIKFYFQAEGMKYKTNDTELIITASEAELNLVEELNLKGTDGTKITDIAGLQSFINLKKVNLSDNNITDITPLQGLTNLISIDLSNNSKINLYNKSSNTCYLPNQSSLQELYIASTNNSDISFVNNLSSLKVLNVSNNGVSVLTPLTPLKSLEVLDVSNNTAITTIDDMIQLSALKELNIATTGITDLFHSDYIEDEYEHGIFDLRNLEVLNVENNKLSIEPVYYTYETSSGDEAVYLKNLEKLNFNYTEQSDVDYGGLALLTELTHLYMKGNGIDSIEDSIATLSKLEYINLSENNIEDISGFIKYGDEDQIESTLAAKQIVLEHNRIQDIEPLGKLGHDITYLDLSSNLIFYKLDLIDYGKFSFSEGLDLTRQGLDKVDEEGNPETYYFEIKKKTAKINQYMILPPLFQNSKNNGSKLYAENITFSYENVELNPDTKYHVPGDYNVIIEPPEESSEEDDEEEEIQQKTLSVTLHGGCADGSIIYYYYTEDETATDSLMFKDENLASAIENDLKAKITSENEDEYYIAEAQDILNITNSLIVETTTLHLEDKEISDLTGLASFENLTHVYLSNNNIPSIDELKYCKEMSELYVSNNPNLGNNITAIEEMIQLTKLDLSTIGMTDLKSIQKLISNCQNEEEFLLTYLNISNNAIGNIHGIGSISSLEDLYISNIGIDDISEIKSLTNLKTLNISGNEIEKINVLQGLTKLKFLTISNNKIEDITPISNISLDSLDFSDNKVKDVSSLTKSYTTLKMDSNQISDISNFEGKLIGQFSATNQIISKIINSEATGNITIELPAIFKSSRQSGSKVYSANNFVIANCELSSDGNSVIVNPDELGSEIATVKINGGNAHLTTFSVAGQLKGTITYNPSNETKTNQDITATITFNRNNVTITNNEGKNTYTFTQNGQFTFEYIDEYGFEGTSTATVNNIDKVAPQSTEVLKEIVNKNVLVTIKVSEPISQPDGWTLAENKLSITKTYTQDANETVNLVDEAGNIGTVNVEVKIDKTAPVITGVENNQKYKKSVTPVVQDENLDTVTLTKDGNVVTSYKVGNTIKEIGQYVLTAIDKFENTTTVSFEIEEILDVITSDEITVIEEQQIIEDVNPETTVAEIRQMIESGVEYEIVDKNGNTISETSNVGTGYKVKMETGKTYTIIVLGDSNGDGKSDLRDILAINKHRLNKASLTGEYLQAGDVNEDGKSDLRDILQINKYRLGKINEL